MSEPQECPRLPEVWRLLDGELNPAQEPALRRHLAECAACAAEYREGAQLAALVRQADPAAAQAPERRAAQRAALLAACAESLAPVVAPRPSAWRRWAIPRPVLWPALALAAVLAGVLLNLPRGGRGGRPEGPLQVKTPPPAPPRPDEGTRPERPVPPSPRRGAPRRPAPVPRPRELRIVRAPAPVRRPARRLAEAPRPALKPAPAPGPAPPARRIARVKPSIPKAVPAPVAVAAAERLIIQVDPGRERKPAAAPVLAVSASGASGGERSSIAIVRFHTEEVNP